jgi:hypothetical protein
MEAFMRAYRHFIAVAAVLIIGLGAKQFFYPPQKADAGISAVSGLGVDVLQIQSNIDMKNLSVQKMNDKTFIFADEE